MFIVENENIKEKSNHNLYLEIAIVKFMEYVKKFPVHFM